MIEKWLYRLESISPDNGLWYNSKNEYVWGCKDCSGDAKNLPMDYDERYHVDDKNWFSSCSCKEDLLHWYSLEDANYLVNNGFVFTRYLAVDYIEYPTRETVFLKETALRREVIDINELFDFDKYSDICDAEYHNLYIDYGSEKHYPFISFEEWLVENGYRFRVKDRLFDSFEKMWAYLTDLIQIYKENVGYYICKSTK